jgi:hypothetical protein
MSSRDGFKSPWAPSAAFLTDRLVRHAAHGAPRTLAERLEEEWLAHLAALPSPLARLWFALGCFWARWVITREHRAASEPVTTGSWTGALDLQSLLPRHTSAFLLIACVHVGVIYLLEADLMFPRLPRETPMAIVTLLQPTVSTSLTSDVEASHPGHESGPFPAVRPAARSSGAPE